MNHSDTLIKKEELEDIVRSLLLAPGLFLVAMSAYGVAPSDTRHDYDSEKSVSVEYVSQQVSSCLVPHQVQSREQEEVAADLVMGIMLAARESGIRVEVVEDSPCLSK